MAAAIDNRTTDYTLGHSSDELKRLNAQANLIGQFTRSFFEEAGVTTGMRLLDVGCGAGDVSLLARELVGAAGEVVGYDLSKDGISAAASRAASLGFQNVSFRISDPSQAVFDRSFDAVVGRYVLMFQQDPAAMLMRLSKHVRSGGIIVFHEADCDHTRSLPPVAIYDQCWRWVIAALGEADTSLGTKLPAVFLKAGLPTPTMRLEALIGGGSESTKPIELIVGLVSTLLPEIERLGMAGSAAIDVTVLAARMHEQAVQQNSVLIGRSEIGAWCRV